MEQMSLRPISLVLTWQVPSNSEQQVSLALTCQELKDTVLMEPMLSLEVFHPMGSLELTCSLVLNLGLELVDLVQLQWVAPWDKEASKPMQILCLDLKISHSSQLDQGQRLLTPSRKMASISLAKIRFPRNKKLKALESLQSCSVWLTPRSRIELMRSQATT